MLYGCYHPLGTFTRTLDGSSPATALDLALPLWPIWIYPYSWIFFLGLLPLFAVREPRLFRRVAVAYCALEVVALACFVLLPVHMTHGPGVFTVDSFPTWGLALTLWIDTPANCFPSLHVASAALAALTTYRADPVLGRFAGVLAVLIAASTLLVKQHYLVDAIGGAGLAWVAYALFVRPVDLGDVPPVERAFSRWWSGTLVLAWVLAVAVLRGVYMAGWRPPPG